MAMTLIISMILHFNLSLILLVRWMHFVRRIHNDTPSVIKTLSHCILVLKSLYYRVQLFVVHFILLDWIVAVVELWFYMSKI
jgi:hypothetical protein